MFVCVVGCARLGSSLTLGKKMTANEFLWKRGLLTFNSLSNEFLGIVDSLLCVCVSVCVCVCCGGI